MRAGLLTEPITVTRPVIRKNEYGQEETGWDGFIATRCQARHKSGNRVSENGENWNEYVVEFTVRRYHKITEAMRIVWRGRQYRILSIFPSKEAQSVTIAGELVNE